MSKYDDWRELLLEDMEPIKIRGRIILNISTRQSGGSLTPIFESPTNDEEEAYIKSRICMDQEADEKTPGD